MVPCRFHGLPISSRRILKCLDTHATQTVGESRMSPARSIRERGSRNVDTAAPPLLRSRRRAGFSLMKSRTKNARRSMTTLSTSGRKPESWLVQLVIALLVASVAFEHERGPSVLSFSRYSPQSTMLATALAEYGRHPAVLTLALCWLKLVLPHCVGVALFARFSVATSLSISSLLCRQSFAKRLTLSRQLTQCWNGNSEPSRLPCRVLRHQFTGGQFPFGCSFTQHCY